MAGRIIQETIEAVNRAADIVAIVGEYVKLDRRGSDWWGCCPFHGEKTPSFHVIPDKNMYYCFGCHKGGSAINFVMEMEKMTFPEAVVFLAKKFGIEVRYAEGYDPQLEQKDNTKQEIIELYGRVATTFHYFLTESDMGKFALKYITDRGLSLETIQKFKLGYSPADRRWLKNFLRSKKFSDDFLAKTGLFSSNYPDTAFFSDRLMFPIFNQRGEIVAFGGRILRGDGPKYLNSGDLIQYQKGETLYAFNFAKQSIREKSKVIFCEGYMDCIAYHQCGITNAVAPLGTALTEDQVKIVKRFADTVLLSFDSDGAGQNATRKAILMCRKQGLTVKIIRLRGGKDPAEIMLNFGPETLTSDVNAAILDSDYLLDYLGHEFPIDTPDGKTKAAQAFFPYIDALQTDIQKESCLDQLGQKLGISPEAVRRDFQNRKQQPLPVNTRQSAEKGEAELKNVKISADHRILLAAIADTSQFGLIRSELSADDFEDGLARELYIILEDCFRQGDLSFQTILNHCSNGVLQKMIMASVASGEYSQNVPQFVRESIDKKILGRLKNRRNMLNNRLLELNSSIPDEAAQINSIVAEMMDIDKKLKQKD